MNKASFRFYFNLIQGLIPLLFFWGLSSSVQGQNQPYILEVELIDSKAGLLGQRIQYTYEDKRGLIWAITAEGLNRYDGQRIKWYKEFASPDYFASNHSIYEDADGFLWILNFINSKITPGAYIINSVTGEVSKFEDEIKAPFSWDDVTRIWQGDDGKLYLSTSSNGLYEYLGGNKFARSGLADLGWSLQVIDVNESGDIWATKNSPKQKKVALVKVEKGKEPTIFELDISNQEIPLSLNYISETQDHSVLFFGYDMESLYFISISATGKITVEEYADTKQIPFSIKKRYSLPVLQQGEEENEDTDYLFSIFGLQLFSSSGELLYDFVKNHPGIRMSHRARHKYIHISNSKLLFVNMREGLLKVHFRRNYFGQILKGVSSSNCRRILSASNGDLIINESDNLGLWRQNNSPLFCRDKKSKVSDFVEGQQKEYWIWNDKNLECMSPENKVIKSFPIVPRLIENHYFGFTIYEVDEDKFFIGGLIQQLIYSRKSDRLARLKIDIPDYKEGDHLLIYDFQKDKFGNLWTASNRGLLLTDFESNQTSSFWKKDKEIIRLPGMDVHHFYQDTAGIFWLAGKNLTRWNSQSKESKVYTFADGLPSSIIHSVYPDDFGNLWLSTENGISCFNVENEQFRNYFTSDGITHNEFNRMSHFQKEDGTIYFGGINGVNKFHPKDFQKSNFGNENNPIIITDYEQFSGAENKILNKLSDVLAQEKIVLNPDDRFFRIHFALPDYAESDFANYEYKISGHQEDWVNINNQNYLQISGLPYGNYQIEIKAKLLTGMYIPQSLTIPIQVLRPFYLELWFIILSVFFIAGIIYFIFKMRVRTLNKQKEVLQELVDQRTEVIQSQKAALENSNAFKDRLFTIIAHDMRNAIYSFHGMANTIKLFIKHNQPEKIISMSDAIDKSTGKLKHLLDNLLEWALSQRGELPYEPEHFSIEELLDTSIVFMEELAEEQSITIEKNVSPNLEIYADKRSIETILRNLLGNALKFTPPSGSIYISAMEKEEYKIISVRDTGVGIDQDDLDKLFEPNRKKMKLGQNGQQGSGVGLILVKELVELNKGTISVESKINEGTLFELRFS